MELQTLADGLEESAAARGWDAPAMLVRVDADGVGLRELGGHPADALLGFTAPAAWRAVGVVAVGWAWHADAAALGGQQRERVRVCVLAARDGAMAGALRRQGCAPTPDVADEGYLADCLRRALGLPTPPPPVGTGHLYAAWWLREVLAATRERDRPPGWTGVVRLHPAAQLLARGGLRVEPAHLHAAATALARVCGWSELHARAVAGEFEAGGMPGGLAAWMDVGMLARWLLDDAGPPEALAELAAGRLSPAVARRLRRSLRGLVAAAGPQPVR